MANVHDGHLHENYIVLRFAGSFLWRYFVEVTAMKLICENNKAVMELIHEGNKTHRNIVFREGPKINS